MELSLFLAKLFGAYFLLLGIVFIWRRKALMPVFEEFAGSRALMVVVAILELFAGIALVIAHNVWSHDFRVIITILGYWMIVESIIYLLLPAKTKAVKKMIKMFTRPSWYIAGSLISIVVGVYLLNAGFTL